MKISPSSPGTAQISRSSRFFWRSAFLAVATGTLVALFYRVEHWRGYWAWERCQRELKDKGEQLDWVAYVPPRVPDEQNFIKTPLLEAFGYAGQVANREWQCFDDARQYLVWEAWVDSRVGRKMDWEKCQAVLRHRANLALPPLPQHPAADLLRVLEGTEAGLDELRAASLKPLAQFDVDRTAPFEESRDVNFVRVRTLSQLLAYHACAELALDHSDKAFTDVRVILRFAEALKGENTLVALMIRVALQGLALEPFWEGWAEGRWSERELAAFQELFGRADLLPEFTRTLHAERAGINALVQKYGLRGNEFWRVTLRSEPAPKKFWDVARLQTQKLAWKLFPQGWVYQNLVSYNDRIQALIPPSLQSNQPIVSPSQVDQIRERAQEEISGGVYGCLGRMAIPNAAKALEVLARTQTFVNEARIACALERFRAARGQYPESLGELRPQFIDHLPLDVLNGEPLKYRRASDGKFLLYSVGWNEKDDGGTLAIAGNDALKPDFRRGDWAWQFPVK